MRHHFLSASNTAMFIPSSIGVEGGHGVSLITVVIAQCEYVQIIRLHKQSLFELLRPWPIETHYEACAALNYTVIICQVQFSHCDGNRSPLNWGRLTKSVKFLK